MRRGKAIVGKSVQGFMGRQCLVQRLAVSGTGGLQDGGFCVQALEFGVDELQAQQLGLGFVGELVEVVLLVIDFDGGHFWVQ